jgi:hypothetical protein
MGRGKTLLTTSRTPHAQDPTQGAYKQTRDTGVEVVGEGFTFHHSSLSDCVSVAVGGSRGEVGSHHNRTIELRGRIRHHNRGKRGRISHHNRGNGFFCVTAGR